MTPLPLVLLTNDDGYRAEGLHALRQELARIARVFTVAPANEMSGVSHAITLTRPLTAEEIEPDLFAVDGTPTDCVNVALNRLMKEPPAACVSGINHGGNLGDDVGYSGTVGAAFEAALLGLPALALSQVKGSPTSDFSASARVGALLALSLALGEIRLAPGTFLNVNAPARPPVGISATRLARRRYVDPIEERVGPEGRAYYFVGGRPAWESHPGTDHHAVIGLRHVAVTVLATDWSVPVASASTSSDELDMGLKRAREGLAQLLPAPEAEAAP